MKKKSEAINNLGVKKGILGLEPSFEHRYVTNFKKIADLVKHCRGLGLKMVLTQGSWDMVHIGHARYLEEAKRHGDFMIVGVDSDDKVKARKGPDRPVVPQSERLEMLCHLRSVDAVFLKNTKDQHWALIRAVRPDVLIAVSDTYSSKELKDLKKYCGEVKVLAYQAETSTSAKLRRLQIGMAGNFERILVPRIMEAVEGTIEEIKDKSGQKPKKDGKK
ncbi:MAG: adenylyltransferase/cytidyltransferase family protein [Parcubacteria group bacterium]|nr:adenylyltransferase/cytidyltransferase family protein [Parcubacteria group bacterium]